MTNASRPNTYDVLYFVWQWKLVTVTMIGIHFYEDERSRSAYNQVFSLNKMGFTRFIYEEKSKRFSITLTKKGFDVLKSDLSNLKDKGFRSEYINHDLIVNAIHYGIYRLNSNLFGGVFTEQELRRNSMELYPTPIPKSSLHRPDGYILLKKPDAKTVFAIEVELSAKPALEYARTREFYLNSAHVKCVWVAGSRRIAELAFSGIEADHKQSLGRHKFYLLGDILKQGWSAPNILGNEPRVSLLDLLGENHADNACIQPVYIQIESLLNGQKAPYVSGTYKNLKILKNRTDLGLRVSTPKSVLNSQNSTDFDPSKTNQTKDEEPNHE